VPTPPDPSSQDTLQELNGLLELMTAVLRRFADLGDCDIDTGIEEALASIGHFAGVDRSYLFTIDGDYINNRHEWCAQGITPEIANLQQVPYATVGWWQSRLAAGETVYVPSVADLPEERSPEREILGAQGIQSLIVVPLMGPDRVHGFIGFDSVREPRAWSEQAILLLRAVADVIISGLLRREAAQALHHSAMHDALTSLPNRALLNDRLSRMLARARRFGDKVGVLFIDLDHFKLVNDATGHDTGDKLLIEAARRLSDQLALPDTIARFGGDEFVVLLHGEERSQEAMIAEAERLLEILGEPFVIDRAAYRITASAGFVASRGNDSPQDLLRDADAAMYVAKERGGGQVHCFNSALRTRLLKRLRIAHELHDCETRGELKLQYQPFFTPHGAQVLGVEALLRWQHPTRGLIPPDEFIPIAEETGLIVPIGKWVLDQALRQLRRWLDLVGDSCALSVAVNLSPLQLQSPDIAGLIEASLQRHRISARRLVLELTESMVMNDADGSRSSMHRLQELGVALAIDDFGTGYSSLAYLRHLPISILKIDRSFIQAMTQSERDGRVVAIICSLGQELGMTTIAEGIESAGHLDMLRGMRCDLAQGFWLMRPSEPQAISDLLLSQQGELFLFGGEGAPVDGCVLKLRATTA